MVLKGSKLFACPEHHINGLPRTPTCLWLILVLTTAESILLTSWWTCFSKSNLYISSHLSYYISKLGPTFSVITCIGLGSKWSKCETKQIQTTEVRNHYTDYS